MRRDNIDRPDRKQPARHKKPGQPSTAQVVAALALIAAVIMLIVLS